MSTPIPDLLALSATLTDLHETVPACDAARVQEAASALAAAHARIEALTQECDSLNDARNVLTDACAERTRERDAALARADAADIERARMQRMLETMPPWRVSDPPTDEELRAIRLRWAFGPERYQADADALIAAVMQGRREVEALTEELDHYKGARAQCTLDNPG